MWIRSAVFVVSFCLITSLVGCSEKTDYPAVDKDQISQVTHGTKLDAAVTLLGPYHEPTSEQRRHLESVLERMPPNVRSNAQRDQAVAWGNNESFFAAVVNSEGVIWVTSYRY